MSTYIEAILSVRKRRLSLQREADLLEQEEKGLTNDLIERMNHEMMAPVYREGENEAMLITTEEPMIAPNGGWPLVLDYIRENDAMDILQKRITPSAVKARWEAGEAIPGVEKVRKYALKFNV